MGDTLLNKFNATIRNINKHECQTWKGWNLCGSSEWGQFMKDHCKKTCGLCDGSGGGGGSSSEFATQQLNKHNSYRATHHAPAMTLDSALNAAAQSWADKLARTGRWITRDDHYSGGDQGENLAQSCSSGSYPSYDDVTYSWYSEVRDYDYQTGGKSASCKRNRNCMIGHFTQVVWKASTKLGIAKAEGKVGRDFCTWVVGRYTPPGNVQSASQYKTNVLRP